MAEVNLRSWPEISQAADGLQLNPADAAMLQYILDRMARIGARLDEYDRRLSMVQPPPRPEPDPPDGPLLYAAAQSSPPSCWDPPVQHPLPADQSYQPYTPQPYMPEPYFHNQQPSPPPIYPPPPHFTMNKPDPYGQPSYFTLNQSLQPVHQQPRHAPHFDRPFSSPTTSSSPASCWYPQRQDLQFEYSDQGPTPPFGSPAYQLSSYVALEPYDPSCNPHVEYHPWQQDQLVYQPPPPTEWTPPPAQRSPSCSSTANSHHQAVSVLEQSAALPQPLPHRPSPCRTSTSHCCPAAPLRNAAVFQPLNRPPPTAISPPCSPNISPVLAFDVVLAAVVPSSMKEETSEGVKYQFGDCYNSLFGERKANGEIFKFDESGQHKIAICNVVIVAKRRTTSLILHILEPDWIWNDQKNFKDIFDVDHYIQYLKTVSIGNYNWTEQFYAIDPGGDTSPKFLMFFVVTWFPP